MLAVGPLADGRWCSAATSTTSAAGSCWSRSAWACTSPRPRSTRRCSRTGARPTRRPPGWPARAAFVLFLLLADFDDRVLQVEVAFLGAAARAERAALGAVPARLTSFLHGRSPGRGSRTGLRARRHRRRVPPVGAPRRAGGAALLPRRQHRRVHAPVLLLPRRGRGLRRARGDGGRDLDAERRVPPRLDGQARADGPAARRPGRQGGEGLRRPQGAARDHARGGDRGRAWAWSATGTTTCSGSTSRPSTDLRERWSRCRRRAPEP